jgi:hypothetical protein
MINYKLGETRVLCFIDFRKSFDTIPRTNLWNRLEEIKFPSGLRVVMIKLYENVISKFRSIKGWSKEIKCNIGVKKGFPLSPTLFGIYIDNLEDCLEATICVGPTLASIVIILLLYADDIFLMERNPYDLSKHLIILKDIAIKMMLSIVSNLNVEH